MIWYQLSHSVTTRLLRIIIYGFFWGHWLSLGKSECSGLPEASTRSGGSFHAFQSSLHTSVVTLGCVKVSSDDWCHENHFVRAVGNSPSDIYLNISWSNLNHTKKLHNCQQYHARFALYSENDVIWFVHTKNLPQNVSLKFYILSGSHIITRQGQKYPTVERGPDPYRHTTSYNLVHFAKHEFRDSDLSSFTEFDSTAIVMSVQLKLGQSWYSKQFRQQCPNLRSNFHSPVVSTKNFLPIQPTQFCRQRPSEKQAAFVINYIPENNSNKASAVDIEISGKGSKDSSKSKVLVIFLSNGNVTWNVHSMNGARERKFLFVTDDVIHVDKLFARANVQPAESWGMPRNDSKMLIRHIESTLDCGVTSYVQYNTSVKLVFLMLDDAGILHAPDAMQDIVHDIYWRSREDCSESWIIHIPLEVLKNYGLGASNINFHGEKNACKRSSSPTSLTFHISEDCQFVWKKYQTVKLSITFDGISSDHFFSGPVSLQNVKSMNIPKCARRAEPSDRTNHLRYLMKIFYDKNFHREVLEDPIVVEHAATTIDSSTYHFTVSSIGSQPGYGVYLDKCAIKREGASSILLVDQNCPCSDAVRFFHAPSGPDNHSQRFAVNMGLLLSSDHNGSVIECLVSTVNISSACNVNMSKCQNLKGNGCSARINASALHCNKTSFETVFSLEFYRARNKTNPDSSFANEVTGHPWFGLHPGNHAATNSATPVPSTINVTEALPAVTIAIIVVSVTSLLVIIVVVIVCLITMHRRNSEAGSPADRTSSKAKDSYPMSNGKSKMSESFGALLNHSNESSCRQDISEKYDMHHPFIPSTTVGNLDEGIKDYVEDGAALRVDVVSCQHAEDARALVRST